ncbi:Zinc finger, SWIM-type [Sesbania bispinosa]|nr:Zinc finger, SWIM-type [Sesbania bispinosa]
MKYVVVMRQGERSEKNMQRKDRCREPRAITRTRCQARLRVRLGYMSGKWTVTHFEPNHNHELIPSTYVHLIPAYRGLSEGDKAQVNSLHMYGVRTCHILGFILGQKGGLCSWHLHQNACENVKNPQFLEEFKTLLYVNIGPDEFEIKWSGLVEKYGVSNNRWVKKIYEMKRLWATAYMHDCCLGGIKTTSICEGINSFIKRYVQNKNSLTEFLHNFERAVKEYRHNELMSDFKTKFSYPVLSTSLYKYEVVASKVCTRNKFWDVRKEIENVAALNVIDRSEVDNKVRVKINKFGSACSEYMVIYDKDKGVYACDCHLFESCGISCSHIFCTMKNESIEVIPESLICKRWTKASKDDFISEISVEDNDSSKLDLLRTGAIADARIRPL